MLIQELEEILKSKADNVSEVSGVIKCTEDIYATYYCEVEDPGVVKSIQFFSACKVKGGFNKQLQHTTKLLSVYKEVIVSMCEVNEDELKAIMTMLGLFDKTFVGGKQTYLFDYVYKAEVSSGLLLLTISEI